jgi:septal ring factor EnvC (AmiA/AmiB activator)
LLAFERTRIDGLEDKVKQLTQERLDKLTSLKERLAESINTLEELERAHLKKMGQFKVQLDSIDRTYKSRLTKITEEQTTVIDRLKKNHSTLIQKVKGQEKTIERLKSESESERDLAIETVTRLQKEVDIALTESRCDKTEKQTNQDLAATLQSLEQTERTLTDKENDLLQLRAQNAGLKRELARVKHEGLLAARKIGKIL